MSRLHAPITLPRKPNIVSLCELAIAAGTTGQSVAVHFHDFPPSVLCQLWRYSMHFAGANETRYVHSQKDIRTLPESCGNVKLILVHAAKLRAAASWAVEMCSPSDTEANSRPAIFSMTRPGDGEDDPGISLALCADQVEATALARWFALGQIPNVPNWQAMGDEVSVTTVPLLSLLLCHRTGGNSSIRHLREQELLRSLVTGAAVLRSLTHDSGQAAMVEELTLTIDDYEQVRLLLQSPSATLADEPRDPLAKDMVTRSNVFLQAKYSECNAEDNPFRANGFGLPLGSSSNRSIITRREIADLGNLRSRLVRQLVEYVRRRGDGYERFQRMGLLRQPPPRERWQTSAVATLIDQSAPVDSQAGADAFRSVTSQRHDHSRARNGEWPLAIRPSRRIADPTWGISSSANSIGTGCPASIGVNLLVCPVGPPSALEPGQTKVLDGKRVTLRSRSSAHEICRN